MLLGSLHRSPTFPYTSLLCSFSPLSPILRQPPSLPPSLPSEMTHYNYKHPSEMPKLSPPCLSLLCFFSHLLLFTFLIFFPLTHTPPDFPFPLSVRPPSLTLPPSASPSSAFYSVTPTSRLPAFSILLLLLAPIHQFIFVYT